MQALHCRYRLPNRPRSFCKSYYFEPIRLQCCFHSHGVWTIVPGEYRSPLYLLTNKYATTGVIEKRVILLTRREWSFIAQMVRADMSRCCRNKF